MTSLLLTTRNTLALLHQHKNLNNSTPYACNQKKSIQVRICLLLGSVSLLFNYWFNMYFHETEGKRQKKRRIACPNLVHSLCIHTIRNLLLFSQDKLLVWLQISFSIEFGGIYQRARHSVGACLLAVEVFLLQLSARISFFIVSRICLFLYIDWINLCVRLMDFRLDSSDVHYIQMSITGLFGLFWGADSLVGGLISVRGIASNV